MKYVNKILSEILIDPYDHSELNLKYSRDGDLIEASNQNKVYEVNNGVINFAEQTNYADNFGDQWTRFPKLQLDSFNKTKISEKRFFATLNKGPNELRGKLILDVGCGTGRFAEIALKAGAIVIGLDYSTAANVASDNLKSYENFVAIRGDINNLPFRNNCFDIVYCLGVLQHTPNVEESFKNLPPMVKQPGDLIVDYYWKGLRSMLHPKYIIRIITSRMPASKVLSLVRFFHPILYPISDLVIRLPFLGRVFARPIPVVSYRKDYPELSDDMLSDWSFLDTYDMWAPKYDNPQTIKTVTQWARDVELKKVEVLHVGHLVVRGKVQ